MNSYRQELLGFIKTMMEIRLTIITADAGTYTDLRAAFEDIDGVELVRTDQVLYTEPPKGLDAIFLVLAAAERWGSRPIPGKAQVLNTTEADQERGMPAFVVSGVVLKPEDPRGPVPETKALLQTALLAIRSFNATNDKKIYKIGFWDRNLLRGVCPKELADIVAEVWH
jgi:hypothetical protein